MPTETVGDYEIEYSGVPLPEGEGWGAHLTIYGPSPNPMHRNTIFPAQRVAVETVFATEGEAEAQAHAVGLSMVEQHASRPQG